MLDFVRKAFRILFVIFLWVIPIVLTIGGAVAGSMGGSMFGSSGFSGGLLGLIAGFILGALIDIYVGGLIATFLKIDENLEILKNNLFRTTGMRLSDVSPVNPVNSGDTWVCKRCGETNPVSSSTCKGCGGYK
jgi:hypothetical protein